MALIRSGDLLRCRAKAVGVAIGCVRGLLAGVAGCRLRGGARSGRSVSQGPQDETVIRTPDQLWVPTTCVTRADALPSAVPRPVLGVRSWSVRTCDDLQLVGLKLIFLTVSSVMSLFRLSHWEKWWKDAEILMLRHQLAVAPRERPRAPARLTWPDRAWLALLAGMLPVDRLAEMRLIVTPGTILRWQRDIVRRRRARPSCWTGPWYGISGT